MNIIKRVMKENGLSTRMVSKKMGKRYSFVCVNYISNGKYQPSRDFLVSFHKAFPDYFTASECRAEMIRQVTESKEFREVE